MRPFDTIWTGVAWSPCLSGLKRNRPSVPATKRLLTPEPLSAEAMALAPAGTVKRAGLGGSVGRK